MTTEDGWYADPTGAIQQRLWAGGVWTSQTRPYPPPKSSEPSEPATSAANTQQPQHRVGNGVSDLASTIAELASDPVDLVRRAVAANPLASARVLSILATDPESWVRSAVAGNRKTPTSALVNLAKDPDADIRRLVAVHPNTSEKMLKELRSDVDAMVAVAVVHNPNVSTSLLTEMAGSKREDARLAVTWSSRCPKSLWTQLASDSARPVREAAARHTTDPLLIQMLASERGQSKRLFAQLAANRAAPQAVLDRLARIKFGPIRSAVASNETTDPRTLQFLLEDEWRHEDSYEETLLGVANNESATAAQLRLVAQQALTEFPTYALEILGDLASSDRTPADVLMELSQVQSWQSPGLDDEDAEFLRFQASCNPGMSSAVLIDLARGDEDQRCGAAANPSTPPQALQHLARERNDNLRGWLASNPALPAEVCAVLVKDGELGVRVTLSGNVALPPGLARQLAASPDELVRRALAANPAAPQDVLEALAADLDDSVRSSVASNLWTPIGALGRLALDEDFDVRMSVAGNPGPPEGSF